MTPAERARLIDRQEFEADCAAARRRAYEHLKTLASGKDERACDQRVQDWLSRPLEPSPFRPQSAPRPASEPNTPAPVEAEPDTPEKPRPTRRPSKTYAADGKTLTLPEWAEWLGITVNVLHQRMHKQGGIQAVVARHKHKGRIR